VRVLPTSVVVAIDMAVMQLVEVNQTVELGRNAQGVSLIDPIRLAELVTSLQQLSESAADALASARLEVE
jgi:hypothetical protein